LTLTCIIIDNLSSLASVSVDIIVGDVVSFISHLAVKTSANSMTVVILTLHIYTEVVFIFFAFLLVRIAFTLFKAIIFSFISVSDTVIDIFWQLIGSSKSTSSLVTSVSSPDYGCSSSLKDFIVWVLMHFFVHDFNSIVGHKCNATLGLSLLYLSRSISHFGWVWIKETTLNACLQLVLVKDLFFNRKFFRE